MTIAVIFQEENMLCQSISSRWAIAIALVPEIIIVRGGRLREHRLNFLAEICYNELIPF
jgi:hypothetical protein